MRIGNASWHEECLYCSECHISLSNSCFIKDGRLFCRNDYERYLNISLQQQIVRVFFTKCLLKALRGQMWSLWTMPEAKRDGDENEALHLPLILLRLHSLWKVLVDRRSIRY
jgi:hypothetical protein